jgi:DNA-binding transcriptional regulator YiaG
MHSLCRMTKRKPTRVNPTVVQRLRKRLQLTQPAMGEAVGVQVMTIWRWERHGVPSNGPSRKLWDSFYATHQKG